MIKLYGVLKSRLLRNLWLAEELELDYQRVEVDFRAGHNKNPEYLAVNPNAKVPAMQDGDLILCESLAINLYLIDKYGTDSPLAPRSVEERGQCYQWTLWAVNEIERPLMIVLANRYLLPEQRRDENRARQAAAELTAPFEVLEQQLDGRDYLLGERFTVADLNLASIMSWTKGAQIELADYPNGGRWLDGCLSRPAFRATIAKHK